MNDKKMSIFGVENGVFLNKEQCMDFYFKKVNPLTKKQHWNFWGYASHDEILDRIDRIHRSKNGHWTLDEIHRCMQMLDVGDSPCDDDISERDSDGWAIADSGVPGSAILLASEVWKVCCKCSEYYSGKHIDGKFICSRCN